MTHRSPGFTWFDWWLLRAAIVGAVFGSLWWFVSTDRFIQQESMTHLRDEDGQWIMTSVRKMPWGPVTAHWVGDYRVIGREDGLSCQSEGVALYGEIPGDIARYPIREWAWPCLDAGPPTLVTYVRTALLFGVIPLRSAKYQFTINPEAAPVIKDNEE